MNFGATEQNNYNFHDFEDEEDISDDEVFVGSQKRSEEDNGVKKPLMAPRRKGKSDKLHTQVRRGPPMRAFCMPMCCALLALAAIFGLIALVVFLVNAYTEQMGFREIALDDGKETGNIVGCSNFQMQDIWVKNFPKLVTETAFRLNDVNGDGVQDVILGFGTGADGYNVPSVVCDVYFNGQHPCFGGLLALDGKSGNEIWRHYADHEIFSVNCNEDINGDGVRDCLGGGRAGVFQAVNGKDGKLLWNFGPQDAKNDIMNVYTGQFIPDSDGDDIPDIIVIHGGDPLADPGSAYRLTGRLLVLSGKDGRVLQWVGVPDQRESYYSPQMLTHPDGTQLVLFGTGGETHPGGLWYIPLNHLLKGDIKKARLIYHDNHKGIMTPPVLVDVNEDGVEDIVMAMFNSTVIAFDGLNFRQLWNYSFPLSESYSTPAAGYFNEDDVPDFLVKYQHGPGFPIYYHSQTMILDGKTGKPLLEKPVIDTVGAQSSGLTISVAGLGNSIFLYWTSDCKGHEGESQKFEFVTGTNVHEQSRSDFCQLRFQSQLVNKMYAISRNTLSPGFPVYESDSRKTIEYNNTVNTSAMAQEYLATHPDVLESYQKYMNKNGNDNQGAFRKAEPIYAPNSARKSNPRGNGKSRVQGSSHVGVARGSQPPSEEYEEDVPYQEPHTVRKHGRFKPKHRNMQTQRGSDIYEVDPAGQRTTDNRWPPIVDPTGDTYGMDSNGRYPEQHFGDVDYNYFGNVDPSYRYQSPMMPGYQEEGQESPWYADLNYGGALKRNHGKKRKYRKRSMDDSGKEKSYWDQRRKLKRVRRHVGPHDMDGIQRLISTGTLAPAWDSDGHNIDLIFATYWFFPAKTQAILPRDRDCIQQKMALEAERFKPTSKYYGMDHDAYEETVTKECTSPNSGSVLLDNRTFQSQSNYDPFNIHMGQMTVYRLRLTCDCNGDMRVEKAGRRCGSILPFEEQGWAAYMGTKGDGHFIPRRVN